MSYTIHEIVQIFCNEKRYIGLNFSSGARKEFPRYSDDFILEYFDNEDLTFIKLRGFFSNEKV